MLNLMPVRSRELFRPISQMMDEPFYRFFEEETRDWSPTVEIYETSEQIVFSVDVPGLEEKDLDISYDDGLLTFSGERKAEEKEGHEYIRRERWYGRFSRSFRLPNTANPEKISAKLRNGVLTVSVPKKEEARPRQIEVKMS